VFRPLWVTGTRYHNAAYGLYDLEWDLASISLFSYPPFSFSAQSPDLTAEISRLPATSGVYLLSNGDRVHLAWSTNLTRRLMRLLVSAKPHDNLVGRLRSKLDRVECWPTGSKLETLLVLYSLAKHRFPEDYLRRLRLSMPSYVGLMMKSDFPRLNVTNRNLEKHSNFIGPFPTKDAAQDYYERVSGLFQIRRCTETLAPEPSHAGCIYGEMNQCLRPCQCGVTVEEYQTEVARVADFLSTNGKSLLASLSIARDRAGENLEFEQAAFLHKRYEKVKEAAGLLPEVAAEVEEFSGVALTGSTEGARLKLWPMFRGLWQAPLNLDFSNPLPAGSLDRTLREQLEAVLAKPRQEGSREEELAVFARWYFASWRDGEWFPFRTPADLSYRRLVRAISKRVS
jgi:excinuclease ABC subunit C